MSKIHVMSEDLANKIAAGEVVEKTMNVVKELVENSIDAKSSEIKINLLDSGVKEITVIDDGVGMDKEDAVLAFSRHATSKLKTLEDLFYINSLGFRGEALPSIAAVSTVILKTCNGEVGTEVLIDGGTIKEVKSSDLKKGTKITVKNLFYNTPVRLKYLKNLYTELANIVDYVNKMALSFPNIRFVLSNNDKVLLNTDGRGNLLKVIGNIYGMDITKKMIEISASNDDYEINGYVSYPECAKSSKNNINILVNGRAIRNTEINKIIVDSYHTYIPEGKYPIVVLNIEVDPILIDVNIHPTKMDIKFSKIDVLKDLINSSIKKKLESINLIPEIKESVSEEIPLYNYDSVVEVSKPKIEEFTLNFEVNEDNETYNDKEVIASTSVESVDSNRIKKMYPVGVVHATYIIAENEDGMYIIDQHAAAERINYEKYLEKMGTHDNNSIDMLIPIKIELLNKDFIILKENMNILIDLGFVIEEFGINTILVRSHPYWLPDYAIEESIRKIIDIVILNESFDSYKFTEKVAITLACKLSIKANDRITLDDMDDLLERLRNTKNPFTCPHGRPTIITYSKYELEKLFKRVMN
ncbi:MAG: DNA mismatch repair endonuclease MutL [Bacilli bacterium]|nr:DNA mismatch repair endonuclease MutL [Bacilli bacterium]